MIAHGIVLLLVHALLTGILCVSAEGQSTEAPNAAQVELSANVSTEPKLLKNITLRTDGKKSPGAIAYFKIHPAKELQTNTTTYYVEWIPDDVKSNARIALLANVGAKAQRPKLLLEGGNSDTKRDCTLEYPCAKDGADWDSTSFYTRPGYAFLAVPTNESVVNVVVQLVASEGGGAGAVTSTLGTLGVQVKVNNSDRVCGGRTRECHGRGDCGRDPDGNGRCVCKKGYGGRFCEDELREWSCRPNSRSGRSTKMNVTKGEVAYLRYVHCSPPSMARLVATIPKGNQVTIYGRARGTECNPVVELRNHFNSLPSRHDVNCKAQREHDGGKLVLDTKTALGTWFFWDFAFYSNKDVQIKLVIHACAPNGCDPSPISPGLPFLILPICLCILCVAAAVVCVLLYVDRRHGFVTGPDKLSDSELQNMCPEYTLLATDDPAHEEHKMCAVCLCEFVVGDKLRRLKCDHRFHSECIDPWLTLNNATCPTCREEARVPELSERRLQRAIIKHVLAPILRLPLRARSRRISPVSRIWRGSQSQQPDTATAATSIDEGINYCVDEARDVPSVDDALGGGGGGTRVSLSSDIEQGSVRYAQYPIATGVDDESTRNRGSLDEDVIAPVPAVVPVPPPQSQCSSCTCHYDTPPSESLQPPPPAAPPDRHQLLPDRNRTVEGNHDNDIVVQQREESGLSTASYYTAPLNSDAQTATALRAQGVLPHVRAALDPAHRR